MDFKKIMETIRSSLKHFWQWLKPYLLRLSAWRKRFWKKYQINKILLLLSLVAILVTTIYLFFLAKSADVEILEETLKQTTVIYDNDGDKASEFKKGTYVPLVEISPNLQNAVISTEDKRFYEHGAFDVKGIGRAFLGIIKNRGTSGGGGSTLTQQLAKNAYLTQEQTFDRKARELFLAIEIEKQYSKDDILTMYLNKAYFGNGVSGVEDASHRYFGKSAAEVTLAEAATLAAMLKGPNIYNPIDNKEKSIERRNLVLQLMVDNGKVSQAEADQAKTEEPILVDNYQESTDSNPFPYYSYAVIDEAVNLHHLKPDDVLNNGYKIYTYLDQNYQQAMQNTFAQDYLFTQNASDGASVEAASVALDPKTGGIQAVVGGREAPVFRGWNRATMSELQPGSTMKPLAVYTPALEAGWKPDDILQDHEMDFYDVKNYDGIYRGEIPMYQAVAESLNASAVWLMHEVGKEKSVKKVQQFGISLDKSDDYYGLALGGLTTGVSPVKMASAYSVFANNGEQAQPRFIRKIVDANGVVIFDNEQPKTQSITTPKVAEEMTSMLQGVFSSGTGVNAQPTGYKMAGKTGSTENIYTGDTGTKDQWIVGYTPDIVIATWMGFDESNENRVLAGSSSTGIAPIFKYESEQILAQSPKTDFSVEDASQSERNKKEETTDSSNKLKEFGEKVSEGAKVFGEKVKDGAETVKDKVGEFWNSIWN